MAYSDMSATEIKSIRKSLGLTQVEFAARLGVNQAAVCHWEKGIRRPSGPAAMLIKMLEKPGISKIRRQNAKSA